MCIYTAKKPPWKVFLIFQCEHAYMTWKLPYIEGHSKMASTPRKSKWHTGCFQDYQNYHGFPWYVPSYCAYMGPPCVFSAFCEHQDGISLVHCNASKSATTIQDIEILGVIRSGRKRWCVEALPKIACLWYAIYWFTDVMSRVMPWNLFPSNTTPKFKWVLLKMAWKLLSRHAILMCHLYGSVMFC